MGEIKGTILSMILAVTVFALVGTGLYGAFESQTEDMVERMGSEFSYMEE